MKLERLRLNNVNLAITIPTYYVLLIREELEDYDMAKPRFLLLP
jgi:hypothetical protein